MVRKSLVETLSAQALDFLEQGGPKPAGKEPPEPLHVGAPVPLNGIERALAVDLWSASEREELRDAFLARYAASLEEAGR